MNHEPRRSRKLLLKRRELNKLVDELGNAGKTLIPLEVFFRRGIVKVRIAVAKGQREYDKRQKLKQADAGKAMRDAMKQRVR